MKGTAAIEVLASTPTPDGPAPGCLGLGSGPTRAHSGERRPRLDELERGREGNTALRGERGLPRFLAAAVLRTVSSKGGEVQLRHGLPTFRLLQSFASK